MLDSIYTTVEGNVSSIWSAYSAVAGLVAGPLQTALAINLVLVGFAIMRGVVNEPFGAYLGTWLRAELAILAATSNFGPWLGNFAWQLPERLSSMFGFSGGGARFDQFVTSVSTAAFALADKAPVWDWGYVIGETRDPLALVFAGLAVGCAYLSAVVAMVMILFTKFALAVTIAAGPIFVAGLIFNSSSGMFFSWLGAALNAAINVAAVTAALLFTSTAIWSITNSMEAGGSSQDAIYIALIGQSLVVLAGAFLIMQAASIASFAGGGGASGSSLMNAVYPSNMQRMLSSQIAGGVGAAAGSAQRGLGRGISAAGRAAAAPIRSGITRLRGASSKG